MESNERSNKQLSREAVKKKKNVKGVDDAADARHARRVLQQRGDC